MSPAIRAIEERIGRVSPDSGHLVISGEKGVGKGFLAVSLGNCSSTPAPCLNFLVLPDREQRLQIFGAEPPEVSSSRRSALENSATVIIKHINHAPPYLQDKLAEAMLSKKVVRFGSCRDRPLSCRIIFTLRDECSLTRNLADYMGSLERIHLPPLRERPEELSVIARHYLLNSADGDKRVRGLDDSGELDPRLGEFLLAQRWEDNVRELIAFLHSLSLPYDRELGEPGKICLATMLSQVAMHAEFSLPDSLEIIKQQIIRSALAEYAGNRSKAARQLGLSERTLRRALVPPR